MKTFFKPSFSLVVFSLIWTTFCFSILNSLHLTGLDIYLIDNQSYWPFIFKLDRFLSILNYPAELLSQIIFLPMYGMFGGRIGPSGYIMITFSYFVWAYTLGSMIRIVLKKIRND